MGIAETMRRRVADELAKRTEPWARKLFDPDTNAPYPEVVETLAQVAVGLEHDAAGDPLSNDAFQEQLAAWMVDTVVVNPTVSKTSYRPQFQTGVRVRMEASGARMPVGRVLDTLAELALGAYEDTHPRALRLAAPNLIVNEYLRGAERAPTAPARVRSARSASAGSGVSAPRKTTKGAPPRRRASSKPGRKKAPTAKAAAASRKRKASRARSTTSAARKRLVATRVAKRRAGARQKARRTIARASTKQARRTRAPAATRRAGSSRAKTRRKKK